MKHLDNLSSRKQLLWRTDKLFSDIATFAQPENISIYRLLGLLLTRCDEKEAKDLGETLWNNCNVEEKQVSLETSHYLERLLTW